MSISALLIVSVGCSSSRTEDVVDVPGPSFTLAPSLDSVPQVISSESLRWEIISPSVNIGVDGAPAGTDHRLTLAIADVDTATWLLQTRVNVLDALALQQALETVVARQFDMPGTARVSWSMNLEILTFPPPGGIHWTVEQLATRPGVSMVLFSGDVVVATVSMDLSTAENVQHRIGSVARTSYGQGILALP
ncbi:MAG: hypothetical protein P8L37_04770 [Phycisphaerales bacterium]|nr:hypothetical protein [Phycisphaerales bacterium]